MDAPTCERLLHKARTGNQESLSQLLESARAPLSRHASRELWSILSRRIDASDIVQQTLLEAQIGFADFRGRSQAEWEHWLFRILKHNVLRERDTHLHAAKRDVRRELPIHELHTAALPLSTYEFASPDEQAELAEARQQIESALEHLPDSQRTAVRLRYLEGKSLDELVTQMGRSHTAVAGLLKRGLQRLRQSRNLISDGCE